MVDIHSHILPKIDDGAKNIDETFKMLKIAIQEGITDIVATPHYCIEWEETFDNVKEMVIKLEILVKEKGLNINVHYGQEVYYNKKLLEDLKKKNIGTINDGRYMLIELDMMNLIDEEVVYETMYELKIKGIVPIIAHPERYRYIQEQNLKINRFIEEGCLFQLNVGSLEGRYGIGAKRCAEILLKNKIYNFIGSDAHNISNRKPEIKKGIDIACKIDKEIEKIFKKNGRRLLENKIIEVRGNIIEKRKKSFSFFKK